MKSLPLLLAVLFCLYSVSTMAAGDPKPGTILVRELNMRSGPGRHNPPIATLKKGDRVYVLSYEGEWVRILYKDQTGFIMNRGQYLRIEEPNIAVPENGDASATNSETNASGGSELAASRQKVAAFAKEEEAVINALEETEKALNRARKKVSRLSNELETIETHIRELEGEYRDVEKHAEANESYVAARLAALYKLSWLGKFHVLASADSMFDFFADKRSLEQILAHDEKVLADLARDKERMQALLQELVAQKNEKQTTTADLSARIEAMNGEQARREALLAEIRNEKSLQMAAIESIKASASALDRTVESFSNAPDEASAPPVTVAEKPFESLKGLLMMPVKGKIISFFGRYKDRRFNVTQFQSGIYIQADRGEPIRAVYSGKTLFSSWFRGFGNMIIIDHGDHYYTVYAHLEEQFKSKGDPVEAGEVIATVGDTGSLSGAGLHFEVRHHGKPMNPLGWIKKG
ncbi:peptidoglycan DD-metalloendopeptidase family protein [uncultured Desulfosarcina sp.]|uniref:peptidoglycan DD-metalloendopeptidase family protein n=1 Tax=uncultured Desulfosarcina sp. TaxID=218289 RepID=UPI0029C8D5C5|nr:peptidoglycan DD-metalloendopeptidase family protein [uncultured Desulfosarcina sp.]